MGSTASGVLEHQKRGTGHDTLRAVKKPTIDDLLLNGRFADAKVADAIIDANLERTMEGASTITIEVHDPKFKILRSKLATEAARIRLHNLNFRLVQIQKQDDDITLTFEDEAVYWMRRYNKYRKAYRDRVTRAEFAKMLVREVKEIKIPFHSPEIHEKQPIKTPKELTKRGRRERRREQQEDNSGPGIAPSENVTIKGKQADREQIRILNRSLDVANEKGADRWTMIALVEAEITESTVRNLTGGLDDSAGVLQQRPSQGWGSYAQVRDIERAVGRFIDLAIKYRNQNPSWRPHQIAQAVQRSAYSDGSNYRAWVNEAEKIVAAYGKGPGAVGGGSRSQAKIERYAFERGADGKRENTWECLGRLAEEVNWVRFMYGRKLYFVSEERLETAKPRFVISEESVGIERINFDFDTGKDAAEATVTAFFETWQAPPGTVIKIKDLGPADDRWLVASVRSSFYTPQGEITLKRAAPKLKEPAPEVTFESAGGRTHTVIDGDGRRKGEIFGDIGGLTFDMRLFCQFIAGEVGKRLFISSGRRYDPDSAHHFGKAADIDAGGIDTELGDQIALAALTLCGRNPREAALVVKRTEYPWINFSVNHSVTINGNRHSVEIGWRTYVGGNHHNHVHVGFEP